MRKFLITLFAIMSAFATLRADDPVSDPSPIATAPQTQPDPEPSPVATAPSTTPDPTPSPIASPSPTSGCTPQFNGWNGRVAIGNSFEVTLPNCANAQVSVQININGSLVSLPLVYQDATHFRFDGSGVPEGGPYSTSIRVNNADGGGGTNAGDGGGSPTATTMSIGDHTPPTCDYVRPPTPDLSSWVHQKVTLRVNSSDALSGVRGVFLEDPLHQGQLLSYLPMPAPLWQYTDYDTRVLPAGPRTFSTFCTDRAGNVRQADTDVRIDNDAPLLSLDVTPSVLNNANRLVRGVISINKSANDGSGIGVATQITTLDSNEINTSDLNTAGYADGAHVLAFTATDTLGNSASTTMTLTFDQTAPIIVIDAPAEGDVVVGNLSQVQCDIHELNGLSATKIAIDGVDQTFTKAGNIYALGAALLENGNHLLTVTATDSVGNVGQSQIHFYSVSGIAGGPQPFKVDFIVPANAAVIGDPSFLLKAAATGDTPVSTHFRVNGTDLADDIADANGIFSRTVSAADLPEGSTTLDAVATNALGAEVTNSITVLLDKTPPVINFISPTDNTTVTGTVEIRGDAQDATLDLLQIFDGSTLLTAAKASGTAHSLSYLWDTTQTSVGTHALEFRVTDRAGHVRSLIHNVTIQSGPADSLPVLTLLSPKEGDALSGIATLLMQVTGTVMSAQFSIDNGLPVVAAPAGQGAYLTYLVTPNLANGFHTIKALATNSAGTVFKTIQVYVDNTPPTVTVSKPLANQILFFTQSVLANVSDNSNLQPMSFPLSSIRFYLDGSLLAIFPANSDINNTLYSYLIDTSLYSKGNHQLMVVAYDKAGNSNQVTVPFSIDNDNPPVSNALVAWTPTKSFVVGPVDSQISATITNADLDASLIDDNTIKVYATKDGEKTRVSGTVSLSGNKLRFLGAIPYNARIQCVLGAIDTTGKLIRETLNFISGMDSALGGVVKLMPENLLDVSIPPTALPQSALVEIVKLDPSQAPPASESGDQQTIYGPFNLVGTDANGAPLDLLKATGRMVFTRTVAQIPPPQQRGYVDRAEQYANGVWLTIGNNGGGSSADGGNPSARTISVPVTKMGVYRITTAAVPGEGITALYNYPNPFSPSEGGTDFSFLLDRATDLHVLIYDLLGNLVIRMDRAGVFGQNTFNWNGRNGAGDEVSNGGYIAVFTTADGAKARRKLAVAK